MATAAAPSSNLLDLVRCELCLEKYNDSDRLPKLLNCSHTFCLACVQKYYESKLKNKLPCPNCRKEFIVPQGGVQNLNTNIVLVNLLDHLAPFTAVDTDEDAGEVSDVPKDNIPGEPGLTICSLHPREKCDFYCDNCRDPLCADCMVSITDGPHKTHKIRKLRDVLTTYGTQHKDAVQDITNIKMEGKQRTEELMEELTLSRDSLMKEAKSKRDKAHQEADRWYQNTTATISKVYDKLHAQILHFMSKTDLPELQQCLEKIDLQKIDGDLKEVQSSLDKLHSSIATFKTSTIWPTKFWSVDIGKFTDDFTVDLGRVTEPTLKLPDVNSFPYTIKKHENTEAAKPNVSKQMQQHQQRGFRLLSDSPMQPACDSNIGMTNKEAVVSFKNQSIIKKVTLKSNKVIDLYQKQLPGKLGLDCQKYILNNNYVLLRECGTGPSYILNSQLELVSTVQENYDCIIGAESTHWVAFWKDSTIQIYDLEQKQLLQTLTPPAGVVWWRNTSICRHPDSQVTAVVNFTSSSLCIYDHDGHLLHTNELQFQPHKTACNRHHLYVVSSWNPVSVFVLSWSGQLVTTLHRQQLRIPKKQKIWNIAVDEDQFTIAVGPREYSGVVSSFKTFQCV